MGADYYEVNYIQVYVYASVRQRTQTIGFLFRQTEANKKLLAEKGGIPIGIGKNSHIRRAIIDKNARIGDNVKVFQTDSLTLNNLLVSIFFIPWDLT